MDDVLVIRLLRCRAKPDVEVQVFGRLLNRLKADAPTPLSILGSVGLGYEQLAIFAALDGGNLLGPTAAGAALRAVLDNPPVLAGGLDALAALEDVVAARLFDVNVLAGLTGPDCCQRVPVIGCCDGYGIDILVFQQLANIDVGIDLLIAVFERLGTLFQNISVHIAQRRYPHTVHLIECADV